MTVGEALKYFRRQKSMTQKDFINDVVSESYYSKVENNLHRINAEDLFVLLKMNRISLQEFIDKLDLYNKKSPLGYLENRMYELFYENKIDELDELVDIANQEKDLGNSQKQQFFTLLAVLKQLDDKTKEISKEDIVFIKKKILEDSEWNKRSLMLFANTLHIFEFEDAVFLVQSLIRKRLDYHFEKTAHEDPFIFVALLLNFIFICIENDELSLTRMPLHILERMPKTPDYTFYRMTFSYYQEVIACKKSKAIHSDKIKTIIQCFQIIGNESYANDLTEFAYTNIEHFKFET